jgi:hypothetical protein
MNFKYLYGILKMLWISLNLDELAEFMLIVLNSIDFNWICWMYVKCIELFDLCYFYRFLYDLHVLYWYVFIIYINHVLPIYTSIGQLGSSRVGDTFSCLWICIQHNTRPTALAYEYTHHSGRGLQKKSSKTHSTFQNVSKFNEIHKI